MSAYCKSALGRVSKAHLLRQKAKARTLRCTNFRCSLFLTAPDSCTVSVMAEGPRQWRRTKTHSCKQKAASTTLRHEVLLHSCSLSDLVFLTIARWGLKGVWAGEHYKPYPCRQKVTARSLRCKVLLHSLFLAITGSCTWGLWQRCWRGRFQSESLQGKGSNKKSESQWSLSLSHCHWLRYHGGLWWRAEWWWWWGILKHI